MFAKNRPNIFGDVSVPFKQVYAAIVPCAARYGKALGVNEVLAGENSSSG